MLNPVSGALNADELIKMALKEDISNEDVSTNAVISDYKKGTVQLICKQDGIICGLPVFERTFKLLDERTCVNCYAKDGDEVKKGRLLADITGDIRVLLSGERVALNFLQRMSGIATYTHIMAALLKGSKTRLLDTRKTTPNMRIFEKYAVKVGGGFNHRYNLSDGVLLKDNHIGAAGGVKNAVEAARKYAPFVRKIEIEVENLEMVAEAVEAGSGGNIPIGSVRYCEHSPTGVAGVTNPAAFSGGHDAESDDSLRQRVLSNYHNLPNGANRAYYESKVLENSAAEAVAVLPKERGPGTVDVYFATAAGVPDKEEIAKVQRLLDSEREICVNIEVKAPETVGVKVEAQIKVSEGYTFDGIKEAAEKALAACFGGSMLGRNVYRARLAAALMAVGGVENCTLVSPEKDVDIGVAQLPVLVSVRVEEAV